MKKKLLPSAISKTMLSLGMALTITGLAHSQVAVTDKLGIAGNKAGFAAQLARTVKQYALQAKSLAQQVQQYEQMLTKITNLNMSSLLPTTTSLSQINDPSPLIQANCRSGDAGGGIIGSLMNNFASLLSQNMQNSQQQICAQIITTQVDKYNKTVAMLSQLHSYSSSLSTLETIASNFSNMGESSAAATQAAAYNSQLTTDVTNWQTQMQADDAIIKTLQDQQIILTKLAMNGQSSSSVLTDAMPDETFQKGVASAQ